MTIKNWFEEFPAIVAKSGATGATGATRNGEANGNSRLARPNLLHPARSAGATGATRYDLTVAPVAPALHPVASGCSAENAKQNLNVSSTVAPVAPVAPHNEHDLDLRIAYEERAAILEYDAGLTRDEAEHQARTEVYGDNPLPETWPPLPEGWQ